MDIYLALTIKTMELFKYKLKLYIAWVYGWRCTNNRDKYRNVVWCKQNSLTLRKSTYYHMDEWYLVIYCVTIFKSAPYTSKLCGSKNYKEGVLIYFLKQKCDCLLECAVVDNFTLLVLDGDWAY